MSYILTLVASTKTTPVTEKHFKEISHIIDAYNLKFTSKLVWLDKEIAAEIAISDDAQSSLVAHLRETLEKDRIDFFVTKNENRQKKLLLADMDSTIASSETLDELAAYAGIKDKIAEITQRAMEGDLDFHAALRERVGLLKGLKTTALRATLDETTLNPGAEVFVQTMRKSGTACVLVSGGFTFFTQNIADRCGFSFNHGNRLEIKDDALTGQVIDPILDKHSKVDFLEHYLKDLSLTKEDCLTIGDGANDLPMLKMAGLGIGYHPKEAVKSDIGNCILYGDLTAALYAQGYSSQYFSQ
ncbi:MAG: phosphoserine phosphatase SerB [Alphaproteobacteria bacterium]|nr:MAG: phosphoserine phosphatase SerB [Alphaproteobacteria bacterium]